MPIQIIPISSGNFSQVVRKHGPDMPSLDTLLSQDRKCTEDTAIHPEDLEEFLDPESWPDCHF